MVLIEKLIRNCNSSFQIMFKKNYDCIGADVFFNALENLKNEDIFDRLAAEPKNKTPEVVDRFLPELRAKINNTKLDKNLGELSSFLYWRQIFKGVGIDERLAKSLYAAQIIGNVGLIKSSQVFMGLFLLAPGICYPLHQHDTLEMYYVVSGNISITHGRKKQAFILGPGEFSITPNKQVHSLATGESACLMSYIWVAGGGDLKGPNWWWEEQTDGSWDRICWVRKADSSWTVTGREKLSEEVISESGDY